MVDDAQVARSKRIQQRTGKTFHFATRLLPQRVRHPTYVLYAFFRVADEVVDAAETAPPDEQRVQLERLRRQALGNESTDDPVLAAFNETRQKRGIASEDVDVFIDAMLTDITKDRYETYVELEEYMDGSAAAVGRMMTAVMDPDNPETALPHATALGEAFQMTNFIRDVREDIVERDRIYLPQETLAQYGVTEDQLLAFDHDEAVAAAIKHEIRRTESLYRKGVAGIKYLPDDCQFAVLLAAVLYADHHRLVRKLDYDVLSTTPELGTARKVWLLARTWAAWKWNKDPEAVFKKVSAVSYGDHDRRRGDPGHAERMPAR